MGVYTDTLDRAFDAIRGTDAYIMLGDTIGGMVESMNITAEIEAAEGRDALRGVASYIIRNVDTIAEALVHDGYATLAEEFGPFIEAAMTISIVLFGLGMLMGWIEYPLKQLGKRILWWSVLLGLILNWHWFSLIFYKVFTVGPLVLGGLLVESTGVYYDGTLIGLLDNIMMRGWSVAGEAWKGEGMIMGPLLALMLIYGTTRMAGMVLGLIVVSKVGLAIVMAMGPLFLIFYMFDSTKHMFQAWLQQATNYAFITILTSTVMAFFIQILDRVVPEVGSGQGLILSDLGSFALLYLVMMAVLQQIMGVASGLAGGLQLNTQGVFGDSVRKALGTGGAMKQGAKSIKGAYRK